MILERNDVVTSVNRKKAAVCLACALMSLMSIVVPVSRMVSFLSFMFFFVCPLGHACGEHISGWTLGGLRGALE